ncbi:MAG TPA: hypothetical protein VL985_09460 [Stellaceae bacterium]|nr:hypothetical protein [Stellaceae bacterium]
MIIGWISAPDGGAMSEFLTAVAGFSIAGFRCPILLPEQYYKTDIFGILSKLHASFGDVIWRGCSPVVHASEQGVGSLYIRVRRKATLQWKVT